MRTKPCARAATRSSATSSRRSAGDRPAAGSSNRISRGAPASAMPISSWRCWPCDRLATSSSATCVRRTRSSSSRVAVAPHGPARGRSRRSGRRVTPRTARNRLSRTTGRGTAARLVGAPQAPADALVRRQLVMSSPKKSHAAGGRREVAGDGVEQRGLARAVGAEDRAPLAGGDRERRRRRARERAEGAGHALEHEGVARRRAARRLDSETRRTSRSQICRSTSWTVAGYRG